jgi:hypothetical protein
MMRIRNRTVTICKMGSLDLNVTEQGTAVNNSRSTADQQLKFLSRGEAQSPVKLVING